MCDTDATDVPCKTVDIAKVDQAHMLLQIATQSRPGVPPRISLSGSYVRRVDEAQRHHAWPSCYEGMQLSVLTVTLQTFYKQTGVVRSDLTGSQHCMHHACIACIDFCLALFAQYQGILVLLELFLVAFFPAGPFLVFLLYVCNDLLFW